MPPGCWLRRASATRKLEDRPAWNSRNDARSRIAPTVASARNRLNSVDGVPDKLAPLVVGRADPEGSNTGPARPLVVRGRADGRALATTALAAQ
jgi:hypothetical protein